MTDTPPPDVLVEIARMWRAAGRDIRELDHVILGAAGVTDPTVALDRTGNVLADALIGLHTLSAPRVDRDDLTVGQWRAREAYGRVHDAIDYLLGRHDDKRPAPKAAT